jgi:hypothetical protein
MNRQILVSMLNSLCDASDFQKSKGLDATAEDTKELWRALMDKMGE